MALSGTIYGSFSGQSTSIARPYLSWSATQNIIGNYSDVTVALKYVKYNASYYFYNLTTHSSSISINGNNSNSSAGFDLRPQGTAPVTDTVWSRTYRVYHNSDGSKSCTISASSTTYTSLDTGSVSATVTLDTIPRDATISSAGNLTIGDDYPFSVSNDGDLYIKAILYVWDGSAWDTVKTQNMGTPQGATTMTLGSTEDNILYDAMPNTTSASLRLRIYTYSNSGYTTQIGDYDDDTNTVYVNQTINKPTFTTFSVLNVDKNVGNVDKYSNTLSNNSISTLLGANTKMIKGYSKLRATVITANKMVALNSATPIKYRFLSGSLSQEEDYHATNTVNLDIDNALEENVSLSAYDSRGLTTTVNDTTSLTNNAEYVPISLWGLTFTRDNGVDSETTLAFNGSYWNEYFGGGSSGVNNAIVCEWRYKPSTDSWGTQTWTDITTDVTDTDGDLAFEEYIEGDLGASGFDTEKSFDIEVRAYDKLTNIIIEKTLSVGTPVLDITKEGIAINSKYDSDLGGDMQTGGQIVGSSPTGSIKMFAGSTAPYGHLLCNGSAISRTTYARLYAVIGTTYGVGDGSTTFNIPNLSGKVPVGSDSSDGDFNELGETGGEKTHTLTSSESGLVGHNHTQNSHDHSMSSHYHGVRYKGFTGLSAGSGWYLLRRRASADSYTGEDSDAAGSKTSNSNGLTATNNAVPSANASSSHNNVQPYIVLNYIIQT